MALFGKALRWLGICNEEHRVVIALAEEEEKILKRLHKYFLEKCELPWNTGLGEGGYW